MRSHLIAGVVALIGMFAESVAAQNTASDDTIRQVLRTALQNMENLRCDGDVRCRPATPEELESPPITIPEARRILARGASSGAAQHCGIDWLTRNFGPMMSYWRKAGKNERQMALVGFLHGIMQGIGLNNLKGSPCSPELRAKIEREIDFRP